MEEDILEFVLEDEVWEDAILADNVLEEDV